MTSAERAKEIVQKICKPLDGGRPYLETPHRKLMAEIIAAAITSAQNDKLEEAERAILNEYSMAEPDDLNIGLLRAARAVKALRLSTAKKD